MFSFCDSNAAVAAAAVDVGGFDVGVGDDGVVVVVAVVAVVVVAQVDAGASVAVCSNVSGVSVSENCTYD